MDAINFDPRPGLNIVVYIAAQIAGACAGAGMLRAALGAEEYHSGIALNDNIAWGSGLFLEFMGTLLLVFVVFNVAVWSANPGVNDLTGSAVSAIAPIPIGFCVLLVHNTLGPYTGCGINPARVLGAVIWEENFWKTNAGAYFWIYFAGPIGAAFVGPLIYFALYGTLRPGTMATAQAARSDVEKIGLPRLRAFSARGAWGDTNTREPHHVEMSGLSQGLLSGEEEM